MMQELNFILTLQATQKEKLSAKKFSELSERDQLCWCREQQKLGNMAYAAYVLFKEQGDIGNAVLCFNIAYESSNGKATFDLKNVKRDHAEKHLDPHLLHNSPETLYLLAMSFLLGINNEKNQSNALILLIKSSEKGYAPAQANLGIMYNYGLGVRQSNEQAAYWFQKAAAQNYILAQSNLGVMYVHGSGVEQNKELAVFWFQKAAEQGYAYAQSNLGVMYEHGSGVEQNDERAVFWFQKAAEQGLAPAHANLGVIYEHGKGVERNKKTAARFYRQAAEQQESNAINTLKDNTKLPVMAFHYSMLTAHKDLSVSLINKEPSLIDELIWDIQRSMEDIPSYLNSVIQALLQSNPWPRHLQHNLNQLTIAYLLKIHEQQLSFSEEKYQECFHNALPLLECIDYSSLDEKTTHTLIYFSIDVWNQVEMDHDIESRLYFRDIISALLEKLVVRLHSIDRPLNNSGLQRLIAAIFVKKTYGNEYETTFNKPDINQLSCFLFRSKINPVLSYQDMNKLLGIELIKPALALNYVELLNRLSDALSAENLSDRPSFMSQLNIYLQKNWNNVDAKNERIAKDILIELSNKTKLFLVCSEKHQNLFFKGKGNHTIVQLLADKNFNSLMKLLGKERELEAHQESVAQLRVCSPG